MPLIVNKEFKADGRMLRQGEIIDADSWKNKRTLLSLGWISYTRNETVDNDAASNDKEAVTSAGTELPIQSQETTAQLEASGKPSGKAKPKMDENTA